MLGIDVKLGANKSTKNQNGGSWLPHLQAPFINLTLGNWQVSTKDPQVKSVKDWLVKCVIPNVPSSGKIPQLDSLRAFLVPRLINSLDSQLQNSRDPNPSFFVILPETRRQMRIYRHKLSGLIDLFTQINRQISS